MVDTEQLARHLRPVFEKYPAIEAVYLFGSTATGTRRPGSDLDLGLAGPADMLRPHKLDLLADLAEAGFDWVDLVILEEADPVMRFEVVRHNHLIFSCAGFDHGRYFSRTLREYFDIEPYLRIQRQAMRERLRHG